MMILKRKPQITDQRSSKSSFSKTIGRFQADRSGATAIEFSMLAVPFFALMFAILESCLSFTAQQLLANVSDEVARDVRTGRLQGAAANEATIKGRICAKLDILVADGCPELEVDLQAYARFADVPKTIAYKSNGDIDTSGFTVNPGPSLSINSIRVFYRWPILMNMMQSYMSNIPGNKMLLYSTATWRNEPFD